MAPGNWKTALHLRLRSRYRQELQDADLKDIDLWSMWDAIHRPTLVLRGEHPMCWTTRMPSS